MNIEKAKQLLKAYGRQLGIMALVALLTFGIIFLFEYVSRSGDDLPQNFSRVYEKASSQNSKVVRLAGEVNTKIEEINKMDIENNTESAKKLIQEASSKNQEARKTAKELSSTLEDLNAMLDQSGSAQKIQVAREALNIEKKLVREFLNYTNSVEDFLAALDSAIKSDSFNDRVSVEDKLERVNQQKQEISSLNQQLVSKIEELTGSQTN